MDQQPEQTSAQIQALAETWYRRQVDTLRESLGSAWVEHSDWVRDYLRQEIRERLIARGWRPR